MRGLWEEHIDRVREALGGKESLTYNIFFDASALLMTVQEPGEPDSKRTRVNKPLLEFLKEKHGKWHGVYGYTHSVSKLKEDMKAHGRGMDIDDLPFQISSSKILFSENKLEDIRPSLLIAKKVSGWAKNYEFVSIWNPEDGQVKRYFESLLGKGNKLEDDGKGIEVIPDHVMDLLRNDND